VRKFPALLSIVVLALLLVACGSDDEESEPTAAPAEPTQAANETEPATVTSESTPDIDLATPGTPGASPIASPAAAGTPAAVASPVTGGTPGAGGSALAIPAGDGTPAPGMQALRGTVSLPGTINEAFVIADDGCVGLGRYAGLEAGQQVIVRDGQGVIIGVTELAATGSAVVCSWTFAAEVPESDYYAISIPTVGERVYAGQDVAAGQGRVDLELP
jgi:hypothetical protein